MKRVAVYAGTRNIYHCLEAAAKSLLAHTRMDRVLFLIEDDEFPRPLPRVIECVDASEQKIFPPDGPNFNSRWTYMSLIRLALPQLLREEARVLYLDADTIIVDDIGSLFEADLGGCPVGAVREPSRSRPWNPYFNAGVLLMDLDAMRGNVCGDLIWTANHRKMDFPDQDALNIVCHGAVHELPAIWNSCPWTAQPPNARIIHFAADREYWTRPLFQEWAARDWRDCNAGNA